MSENKSGNNSGNNSLLGGNFIDLLSEAYDSIEDHREYYMEAMYENTNAASIFCVRIANGKLYTAGDTEMKGNLLEQTNMRISLGELVITSKNPQITENEPMNTLSERAFSAPSRKSKIDDYEDFI